MYESAYLPPVCQGQCVKENCTVYNCTVKPVLSSNGRVIVQLAVDQDSAYTFVLELHL